MTSVSTVVERCRRRLYAQGRGRFNFLDGALTTTTTDITLSDELQEIQPGVILGIGSEVLLVRPEVNRNGKTFPVHRGFLGTTAAAHSDAALVEVAPRFPVADIVDTIRDEINSWGGSGLFAVVSTTLAAVSGTRAYDITDAVDLLYALSLEADITSSLSFNDSARSSLEFRILRDQPTGSFPSTYAVQLTRDLGTSADLRLTWAQRFQTEDLTTGTDLEDDVGLRPSMIDLLVIGVCWRLMSSREIARTDIHASGETRRGEEVPPGFSSQTAARLLQIRDRRISDEAVNLRRDFPYRIV